MAKHQSISEIKNENDVKKMNNIGFEDDSSISDMTAVTNDFRSSLPSSINECVEDNVQNFPIINNDDDEKSLDFKEEFKVYRIRHFLLLIFITLSMTNAFHWIEYAIIEKIVCDYYRISTFWVNCTSVIFMIIYIIGITPATFMQDRYGLRVCLIFGSFINALGSCIKCLSVSRSRFWVAMIGQTLVGIAQLFTLNIPPMLAAQWFPSNEVTRATAFGVFGNQVGIALGFLIPPLLMPELNSTSNEENLSSELINHIEHGFHYLVWGLSIITTVIFLLILIFFKNRPEQPPSKAQALIRFMEHSDSKQSYFESIKQLIKNRNFVLLFINYGLITGVFYALSTVLSQMITRTMGPEYLVEAGYMGLTITLSGITGSVVCGYLLGWSGKFRLVNLLIYIFSFAGTAAFGVAIEIRHINLLFITCAILGFFMTGYLPIGFEFAAEVSYPQPESTSAGLLNASAQIFGIIFTYASTPIIDHFNSVWANIGYSIVLVIGVILSFFIKNDLRRQNAHMHSV
uniref:Uncharacterized MFS-type transporter C09D4.1-like n=1 Tax=Dermatophagoides pteronyssinus TaxID=6956 RepID=A0A6P6XWH4_DERPT|nr:uncharacterized MFS-type transporter C09D4.1-like [Dermatophagoides pteronyssinus]